MDDAFDAGKFFNPIVKNVWPNWVKKPIPINTTPVKLSQTPGTIRQRTAELGEHTDEILNSLGYTPDKISEMRYARVV